MSRKLKTSTYADWRERVSYLNPSRVLLKQQEELRKHIKATVQHRARELHSHEPHTYVNMEPYKNRLPYCYGDLKKLKPDS